MDMQAQRHAACCELIHEVASAGGEVSLVVHGASMLPAVWPGDQLTTRSVPFDQLRPGQVILFHRDGKLTAHRILSFTADGVVTRGDSLSHPDRPVRAEELVGRVERVVRNGRSRTLELKLWKGVVSWLLRRSDLGLRATLFFARRLRGNWEIQAPAYSKSSLPIVNRA